VIIVIFTGKGHPLFAYRLTFGCWQRDEADMVTHGDHPQDRNAAALPSVSSSATM
jgi:hypothetical protein